MAGLQRLVERAVTTNEPNYWAVLFDQLEETGALADGDLSVVVTELNDQGGGKVDLQKWKMFFAAFTERLGSAEIMVRGERAAPQDQLRAFFWMLGKSNYETAVRLLNDPHWRYWLSRELNVRHMSAEIDGMNSAHCHGGEHWERDLDREKMEWLVGETGNFETEPLKYQTLERGDEAEIREREKNPTLWAGSEALWLDFAPEWMAHDELEDEYPDARFLTIYGGQSPYPLLLIDGEVWELVRDGAHTPEVACPFIDDNDDGGEAVRLEHTYCGEYPGERCRFCESELGEDHGVIYMGEGAEAVYAHTPEEEA